MISTFHIDLPNWLTENVSLKVVADLSAAEPDVGIRGNGREALEIISVYCSAEGYDPEEDIRDRFSEDRLDDIAHIIYQQLEE